MIVTILQSSPTFEAVNYNERKVAKGEATMLAIENFGYLESSKDFTSDDLRQYLIEFSKRNERIQKAQFHVAFSCKGQEMNHEELVVYARRWLAEMGYNAPKQPLLIYAHNDTDNNHIHVITSRVDSQGRKIDHNHERVRSKNYVDRTLGIDTKCDINSAIANSLTYSFETFGEWQAIIEAAGYSVAEKKGILKIACNGAYQQTLNTEEIEKRISKQFVEKKRLLQLKALLKKYRDLSASKEELQEVMKKKFGVDLVFFGGKDNPRGYFVVDHKNKQVCKGSAVLNIAQLLKFEDKEEKTQRIDAFIDAQFEKNPQLTGQGLHLLLKRHYSAAYRGGIVFLGGEEKPIKPYMAQALRYNSKLEKIQNTFTYQSEEDKAALSKFFKVDSKDLRNSRYHGDANSRLLKRIKEILSNTTEIKEAKRSLDANSIRLMRHDGKFYAVTFSLKAQENAICCLDNNGIYLKEKMVTRREELIQPSRKTSIAAPAGRSNRCGSSSNTNREFEVGTRYDGFDDERKLKR